MKRRRPRPLHRQRALRAQVRECLLHLPEDHRPGHDEVVPVDGDGYSFWVTPKTTFGLEGLFRYDKLNPNDANDSKKERVIAGIAYWPKMTVTTVNTAILLDVEQVNYRGFHAGAPDREADRGAHAGEVLGFVVRSQEADMQVSRFTRRHALAALAAALTVSAASADAARAGRKINGAGATFPYPIYSKWFSEYNKLKPGVEINYQSIGSGGGIRQLTNQTVFFGATDGPMTDEQLQAAPGKILHLPTVLGAVVPDLQPPRRDGRAEVHRPAAGRHLPRQDHEVERPGDRQAQPRRHAAGHRHHRRPPLGRVRHDATSGSTTSSKVSPEWKTKVGVAHVGRTGRSASAARATRAWPAWSSRRPARSATSS